MLYYFFFIFISVFVFFNYFLLLFGSMLLFFSFLFYLFFFFFLFLFLGHSCRHPVHRRAEISPKTRWATPPRRNRVGPIRGPAPGRTGGSCGDTISPGIIFTNFAPSAKEGGQSDIRARRDSIALSRRTRSPAP